LADFFQQVYDPVRGSVLLSALVASLPPLLLAVLLAVLRIAPWRAAIASAAERRKKRL
jgi:lactate permease